MSNLIEIIGYALIVAFLYFLWAPLALLGGGLLLVMWANVRTSKGRTAAALAAALAAARAVYTQRDDDSELPRRIA